MSGSIISARVLPRGGDKEVGVNRLVEQGVDGVGAWTVLQQRRRQLQTDARELSGLGVLG